MSMRHIPQTPPVESPTRRPIGTAPASIDDAIAANADVPTGYKRTKVGVIPEDWEVSTLRDVVVKFVNGGTPSTRNESFWSGAIPWITGADILSQRVAVIRRWITEEAVRGSSTTVIAKGNLLIVSRTGVGKLAIAPCDIAISQDFTGVVPNREKILADFLFRCFVRDQNVLTKQNQGTSIKGITRNVLAVIPIPLPPLREQRAIADALSDVDGLLESLDALIAKKRAIKKATMQQLLTGKTRLPGFGGAWRKKRLREFVFVRKDMVIPTAVPAQTPCVELDHIEQGSGRLLQFSKAQDSIASKYRFFAGDVLFGRLRSYLRKCWLADFDGLCTTEIWPLVCEPQQAESGFLHAIAQTDPFAKAASISYGTHMPRADWSVMQNFEVYLPDIREQRAITTMLSDMDAEIATLEQRRDKYRTVKRGMMQQLLTGKVRLI